MLSALTWSQVVVVVQWRRLDQQQQPSEVFNYGWDVALVIELFRELVLQVQRLSEELVLELLDNCCLMCFQYDRQYLLSKQPH